jgi:small subunit ribosomal protein S8e
MVLGRKITGGRYIQSKGKKLYERPGQRRLVKLGEEKRKVRTTTGGNKKTLLFSAKLVNVQGKNKRVPIKNVLETPSNRFLARQNIITKGTIIDTEFGKVKITNRPAQEGIVNGVIVK